MSEEKSTYKTWLRLSDIYTTLIFSKRSGIKKHKKAWDIWLKICGEREKNHTKGVYLDDKIKTKNPVLIIYVDSSTLVVEFRTNKIIYVERLKHDGFYVNDIIFKLSKKNNFKKESFMELYKEKKQGTIRPLDRETEQVILDRTEHLPKKIKESVRSAMKSSLSWVLK